MTPTEGGTSRSPFRCPARSGIRPRAASQAFEASPSARPPQLVRRSLGSSNRDRQALQARHGSRRTEKAVARIRRYILFHGKHPADMGAAEITQFLSSLAVGGNVAASTQNQALSALLFLCGHVLEQDPWLDGVVRAKRRERLPVVLSRDEVRAILCELQGPPRVRPLGQPVA